jgi:hypothetical protein
MQEPDSVPVVAADDWLQGPRLHVETVGPRAGHTGHGLVRDALGRPGAGDERLATAVTDTFLRAVPHALRDYAPDPGTRLHIQVTGPGHGIWTIGRRNATWVVGRGWSAQSATALVEVSSECLWRGATRGITVETAREHATISGDQTLGSAVLNLVAIIR